MKTRVAKCGHLVPVHPGRQRRACTSCRKSTGQRSLREWTITCRGCGVGATVYHQSQLYCDVDCRVASLATAREAARPVVDCLACAKPFVQRRADARFCSSFCGDVHRGQRLPAPLVRRVCALPGCDVDFQPKKREQRCCGETHSKKLWHVENPGAGYEWNDKRRDAYHRRRALKKATSSGRPVILAEIRERDKNCCHLCGDKVPAKAYPHPLSPSLDHVIPLSKGGIHDPSNVKLAHLRCNVQKGDGGGNEQLMLIG